MRLFFAIPLPDDVRHALSALATDLGRARWVPTDQLHLTLRFIGDLDEARASELVQRVQSCTPWPALTLRARGVGVFGSPARARVLWTAIEPAEGVRSIAAALDACAAEIGLIEDARGFRPHVTLARFKQPDADRLRRFLSQHASFATPLFHVAEVILYQSTLDHRGAIHKPHARFGLQQ